MGSRIVSYIIAKRKPDFFLFFRRGSVIGNHKIAICRRRRKRRGWNKRVHTEHIFYAATEKYRKLIENVNRLS